MNPAFHADAASCIGGSVRVRPWRFRSHTHDTKSASRRRAVAALWRAAKAEGLAQSKTCRSFTRFMGGEKPILRAAKYQVFSLRVIS
jgi:hypothetical protein